MNRKTRRAIASLSRRRKWHLLSNFLSVDQVSSAREFVDKLKPNRRRLIGYSVFALRHEEHRRGNVFMRELNK